MSRIAIIGGGAMGGALAGGLVASARAKPEEVTVAEVDAARRGVLTSKHGVLVTPTARDAVTGATIVVLALKQAAVRDVCNEVSRALDDDTVVVSIVAGMPTATIEAWLPRGTAVVRAMPNTAAMVGAAVTAISPGRHASHAHMDRAADVLSGVGVVVRVPEHQLDAVTALSGSGPAYFFLVVEALVEAGVRLGLSREVSAILTHQTMAGAARLLAESDAHPAELRAQVTSPGGTTAAALAVLERYAVRYALLEAAQAAAERSAALGAAQTP
jgi:pyrroline-5-carboxylate reductase